MVEGMTTLGTMFSGFGGVDIGAMTAGITPLWGVEYDAAIAEVANGNLGGHVRVAEVLDCSPFDFDAVDILHASPPCPNFSVAKVGGAETALDIAMAEKVAEFITVLRPHIFTLENVWAYRHSKAWFVIENALNAAGYWSTVDHVNCADYGVPQTRMRMIARAVLGDLVPPLPISERWVGWHEAIEDLIPSLPDSQFAPWQLARLPEELQTFMAQVQGEGGAATIGTDARGIIVPGGNANAPTRGEREPLFTLTSSPSSTTTIRAMLVNESSTMEVRAAQGSCAAQVASQRNLNQRAWLDMGRVVGMTSRALARFQSFPDRYELPEKKSLAARGIGNAVPPLLMQKVYEGLI